MTWFKLAAILLFGFCIPPLNHDQFWPVEFPIQWLRFFVQNKGGGVASQHAKSQLKQSEKCAKSTSYKQLQSSQVKSDPLSGAKNNPFMPTGLGPVMPGISNAALYQQASQQVAQQGSNMYQMAQRPSTQPNYAKQQVVQPQQVCTIPFFNDSISIKCETIWTIFVK